MLGHEPPSLMGVDLNTFVRVHRMIHGGGIEMESRVGVQIVDDLPNIEDSISFSPPLHAVQLVVTEPIPVVMVGRKFGAFNLACEVSLEKTT